MRVFRKWPLLLALFLPLIGCVYSPTPLKFECQIVSIYAEQPYYEYLGTYGSVRVDFGVKNTGNIWIDTCTLTFDAICKDGSVYRGYGFLSDLAPGEEIWDYTYISTSDKEASEVVLRRVKLINWNYDSKEISLNITVTIEIIE